MKINCKYHVVHKLRPMMLVIQYLWICTHSVMLILMSLVLLPLAMYRLMGAYRMDAAAGAALLLLGLSLLLFWICDHWGRGNAEL